MTDNQNTNNLRSEYYEKSGGLADCTSVLDEFEKEIRNLGFAGDANIPKLIFLTCYTSLLPKPVSLVVKGPSSSGKSFSLDSAIRFIPETAYERFEGMSEKAIVYLKDLDLKHKHLVIGEAAGMSQGSGRTLLRQLLSEGQIRYATVENTSDGLKGSELPRIEGPTGLIMTTTANSLHHEDETRMLSVNMPESLEQVLATLMAQANGVSATETKVDTARWHAFFEYVRLSKLPVHVPFAVPLAASLPKTHDRIRRDFPQLLALIHAHALLHLGRRQTWEAKLVATESDYAAVRELLNEPLSQGLATSVPEPIRRLVSAVESFPDAKDPLAEGVSVTKLADLLQRDVSAVSRTVSKAVEQGFLKNLNPGQGREAKLVIGEREIATKSVLPSVESLFNKKEEVAFAE